MTIDDTTVGFAVVGAGLVGPRHAAAAQAAGGRLVAVVDTVEERARALAGQHGAEWSTEIELAGGVRRVSDLATVGRE